MNENCLDVIGNQNVYIETSYFIHIFIPITIKSVTSKTLLMPSLNQSFGDRLYEDVSYIYTFFLFQRYFIYFTLYKIILVCVNLIGIYF